MAKKIVLNTGGRGGSRDYLDSMDGADLGAATEERNGGSPYDMKTVTTLTLVGVTALSMSGIGPSSPSLALWGTQPACEVISSCSADAVLLPACRAQVDAGLVRRGARDTVMRNKLSLAEASARTRCPKTRLLGLQVVIEDNQFTENNLFFLMLVKQIGM